MPLLLEVTKYGGMIIFATWNLILSWILQKVMKEKKFHMLHLLESLYVPIL